MIDLLKIKKCIRCKNPFTSNSMIKGDDVCRTCNRMNSMIFWYPRLQHSGIPTPKTIFVYADFDIISLLEVGKLLEESGRFGSEMKNAVRKVGLPAFIRTEMLSNKHDWKKSCFLENENDIFGHLHNLVEMSSIATIDRMTDCDFFVVREMILTNPFFTYFEGEMPITKELRVFVNNGEIVCAHPYWPKEVFKEIDEKKIDEVRDFSKESDEPLKMAKYISGLFSGYWSVDFLKSKDGKWFCTDMAIGESSWHQENCEKKLKTMKQKSLKIKKLK